ncbi:Retrovirus-related Pol polyprotein from transposon TNT 1-94 [Symbiodinium microadriaticum]|uniref:Retrovirus-related Pol polyprotein from transposon TNT 1-94 n=1 Tax=Symbiodinium microadriaticum TaxID=2951 RepID=A0A1Q9DJ71_SYMMI|nr:Retrovirus-related Pol polyprotein from transposon TNT 1-94 [Symbiodinium microadriaticum]
MCVADMNKPPRTGEHVQFMLIIDETSRRDGASTLGLLGFYDWIQLELSGEAHHQIGVCEQAVKGIKEVMGKLCDQNPELTVEEALSTSVNTFNCREVIRGFSPMQHLMGQNPDLTGRFMAQGEQKSAEKLIENPTGEIHRAAQLRAEAEKAHADWNASQRIKRAMNSRTKPSYDYVPGRSLIKCAPEQIRRASEREGLLESLVEGQRATPWTFTKVAEEIGGNQYQDVTQDVPSVQEWQRAQDLEEEEPPRRIRLHGKRPGPASQPASGDPEELPPGDSDEELIPAERPRVRARASREPAAPEQAGHWCEDVRNHSWEQEPNAYWQQKEAAVEVAIEWPEAKRAQELAMRDMSSYFIGAMKRRAAEVSEKRMTEEERKLFASAKAVEVRNFVAAKAFEIVPEHQQPSKEQAMNMRWILTWKLRDDGTSKPKARAVILGYQDPGYEHRATTSPVMNRQTRQFLLQVAANRKWSVYKGDVSGAFLQGRPYPEDLFCIPCPEICEAMSIPAGTVTKMKRACYGVVDAPLEWYRTVSEFLAELGFERQWSDACSWVKRKQGKILGMVAGHVDDFLFTGEESDPEWQDLISRIKAKFNWGDWDKDVFCQCGVSIKRNVFDKLETEVLSIKGAEKRTNIEMISLKESQQSTKVEIRWVHSEAQLANALTKVGNAKELELFYRMHHRWRIVEDPQMR